MAKPPSPDKKSKSVLPKNLKKIKKGKINKATAEAKAVPQDDRRKKWKVMLGERATAGLVKKPNNQNGNKVNAGQLADIGIHLGPQATKKNATDKLNKVALNFQKKKKIKTLIKKLNINTSNVKSTDDSSNKSNSPTKANKKLKKAKKAAIANTVENTLVNKVKKRTRSKRKSQRISEGLETAKANVNLEAVDSPQKLKKKKNKKAKKSLTIEVSADNNDAVKIDPLKKGRGRPKTISKEIKINGNVENQESIKKGKKKHKKSKKGLTTDSNINIQETDKSTNNELNESVSRKRGRPLKKKRTGALPKLQDNSADIEANGKVVKKKHKESKTKSASIFETKEVNSEVSSPKNKKKSKLSESIQIGNTGSPKKEKKLASPKKLIDDGNRRSERTKDKKDLTDTKTLKAIGKKKEKIANGKAKKSKKMKKAILNVLDDGQIIKKKKKSL